jgi:quercetin dioxygenase-like cupin family protein
MCRMIDRLEELYEGLPDTPLFEDLYLGEDGEHTLYRIDTGTFKSRSVLNISDISIAHSHITGGSTVELHNHHSSYEILIVLSGSMEVTYGSGKKKKLVKYDYIILDKQMPHSALVIEDTDFVAITVPKDEGFPK